ncbi:hypothetical protein BST30_04845 [Mycobacterium mantenii]|uniref:Uncharacterized protein n=1 Tax=Mycobacterium mantenii TaxID=560555 RepID=A0A1X0G341_MYCNT|nr:hypothetical protein BST30_04845 [Mycobacterium mantenii]
MALQNEGLHVLKRPAIMTHAASRRSEKCITVIAHFAVGAMAQDNCVPTEATFGSSMSGLLRF